MTGANVHHPRPMRTTPKTSLLATNPFLVFGLLLAGCRTVPPVAPEPVPETTPAATSYLFGWGEVPAGLAKPRGGSTRGAPVEPASPRPLPLPEVAAATTAFERDRAAILALAGDFRTGFHFLETLAFAPDPEPRRPYHSWATEHVRVLAADGRFISLQHTLVMFFLGEDGAVSEPMVMKHWRQDWTYEPRELHEFRGDRTWARRAIPAAEAAGAWSQSVWQVDDSPRYAALGRWTHDGNRSAWTGESAWRPLPRREHGARSDYDVMEGAHRIVLTPTGWLHEQHNWKRVAGEGGGDAPAYVGREIGLDRYERIAAPSLEAADAYWEKTAAYWAAVRAAWADVLKTHDRFVLQTERDGARLFEEHFAYAGKLDDGAPFDAADATRHARETIEGFLDPLPTAP